MDEEFAAFVAARARALCRTAYLLTGDWQAGEDLVQEALTETSLTPPGWAPVAYLSAQVSVPGSWLVDAPGTGDCGDRGRGVVFPGQGPRPGMFRTGGCRTPANVIVLTRFRSQPSASSAIAVRPNATLNGIRVLTEHRPGGRVVVIAPSLGVRISARGPLAGRIVATLTRSPISVVLSSGPEFGVPSGWRWHRFGGIRFAAPVTWATRRDTWWGGCPYGIAARVVQLSTASALFLPSCPALLDTAANLAARPGVVVGSGRYAALPSGAPGVATCPREHGLRACVAYGAGTDGTMTVVVTVPGRARSALVVIGLAGSGATTRTILDSIGPQTAR
ncbi:MAG: hypothetical protein ACYCVZ_02370 [Streptosporangiaceae bacterium]